MTSEEFFVWRTRLYASRGEAAEALGVSVGTIENYEKGKRREDNREVHIPKSIALATAALILQEASNRNAVHLLTREVRNNVYNVSLLLSLPTSSSSNGKATLHATYHDLLKKTGEIPSDELSLMQRLFPNGDIEELRKQMYRN